MGTITLPFASSLGCGARMSGSALEQSLQQNRAHPQRHTNNCNASHLAIAIALSTDAGVMSLISRAHSHMTLLSIAHSYSRAHTRIRARPHARIRTGSTRMLAGTVE